MQTKRTQGKGRKMKTCGNCGTSCTGRQGPRDRAACTDWQAIEPTELQRAQWWFCGWCMSQKKLFVGNGPRFQRTGNAVVVSAKRLEAAIRATAAKERKEA